MLKRKNRKQSNIRFYFTAIILIGIIVFLFFQNFLLFLSYEDLNRENNLLEKNISIEEQGVKETEEQIEYLNNKNGIFKAILEIKSVKREGERVIEILDY